MPVGGQAAQLKALRAIPLFGGLSDAALRRIGKIANEVEVVAGQVLMQPDMAGSGLCVLEEGTVVVERGSRRFELGPGEFFGDLALLTGEAVHAARVRALTPVRMLAIRREDFLKLLTDQPKIAVTMVGILAQRLADTVKG